MKWKNIITRGFIIVAGQRYELGHVQESISAVVIPPTDGFSEIATNLRATFSSHCVSKGPKDGEAFDFNVIGHDYKIIDQGGVERKFCFERYELSKHLPRIIATLPACQAKNCFFASSRNFVVVEVFRENGESEHYHVFFNVRKSIKSLDIYVESAYSVKEHMPQKRGFRVIRSSLLLAKTYRNEKVKR